jgi:hypothetical protein
MGLEKANYAEEGKRKVRKAGKPDGCQGLQKGHLLRLYSEAGGRKFLQSTGINLPKHTASHLGRPSS